MNIRASMLPGYPDCPRRAAAKQFRRKFEKLGYEFRQTSPHVGSASGTATHTGGELILRSKWEGKTLSLDDAMAPAIEGFREETGQGCTWDQTTPNANVAEFQIKRMLAAYLHGPAVDLMPLTVEIEGMPAPAIELHLEASVGDGWMLTGTMDVVSDARWVRDTKTGAAPVGYHSQQGAYALLVRSNKIVDKVEGIALDYIKRCAKTKPQDPAVEYRYPVAASEGLAISLINRIKSDMAVFDETCDLNASFMCNLSSKLCGDKFCPAWGTDFCELSGG